MKPAYPVYIVSKGRWANNLTSKSLNKMGVPHYVIVEESEYTQYKENVDAEILVLPQSYLDDYETCDDLGDTKSKGPGAARNFAMAHSGCAKRHWVMDDNLQGFFYMNRNDKIEVETGAILKAAEDFVERYDNVPIAGLNYEKFCKKFDPVPPFVVNTRIYSCLLIENGTPYRWRGRYNEDTDICLRVLKDGHCTIQFNTFLCGKVTTQRMGGGNSAEFYEEEGTLPKSQMLVDLHPDVASVSWKFNRWHHEVDYKRFKRQPLIKTDLTDYPKINTYGLKLISK